MSAVVTPSEILRRKEELADDLVERLIGALLGSAVSAEANDLGVALERANNDEDFELSERIRYAFVDALYTNEEAGR